MPLLSKRLLAFFAIFSVYFFSLAESIDDSSDENVSLRKDDSSVSSGEDGDVVKGHNKYHDKYGHYEHGHHYHEDKYDYSYGKKDDKKDKYDKYDKKDKYDKYDKDKYHQYEYGKDKCQKEKSFECIAYIAAEDSTLTSAQLFQSVNGQLPTLASTYTQPLLQSVAVSSNRARGAYCSNYDIEMAVGTTDLNSYLTRFEATSSGASRVYTHETGLELSCVNPYFILTTRILLKRMYKIIDAYFLEFSFGYAQYDVNPLTNTKVSVSFPQSVCYDTAFFKNECSRFICQGVTGSVMTTYTRDPDTGVNFVPPTTNNPWVVGKGDYYTSVRICKHNYIASIGFNSGEGVLIARSRVSLKYPYFKDMELIYDDSAGLVARAIYTPAHSNVIYACYDRTFVRFDNAYTKDAPLTPDQVTALDVICMSIISFNKCPDEIYYVSTSYTLFYSNDGGATFVQVAMPDGQSVYGVTGFSKPVKDYY